MARPARSLDDRTARAILEAAAHVLAEHGATVSLADVAAAAGVARATLYRYYPNREALISALSAAALDEAAERVAAAHLDGCSVPQAIERFARAVLTTGDRFAVLQDEPKQLDQAEADRRLGEPLRAVVRRGQAGGEIRDDLELAVLLELFGGMLGAALRLARSDSLGVEDAAAAATTLFLQGARPRAAAPAG